MKHFRSYIICTSPHSGSTLLCRLLKDTDVAGCPDSHFHSPSLEDWLNDYGLQAGAFADRKAALRAVLAAARVRGTDGTDMFGLRLQRQSFGFLMAQLGILHPEETSDKARTRVAFGRTLFIHLTRKNKLHQAISYVKASQSGLWHVTADGTEIERLSPPKEPTYDGDAIAERLALSENMDRDWQDWFKTEKITPLRITYEDLSADPSGVLDQILIALGKPSMPPGKIVPLMGKMADATNKDWANKFRSDHRMD